MITKLIIENFKAIDRLEVPLGPFTVLVGRNDSGKSTILEAMELLSRVAAGGSVLDASTESFDRYLPQRSRERTLGFEVVGAVGGHAYRYRISFGAAEHIVEEELEIGTHHWTAQAPSSRARIADDGSQVAADLAAFAVRFDPRRLAEPSGLGAPLASDGAGLASLVDALLTAPNRGPLQKLEAALQTFSPHVQGVGTELVRGTQAKQLVFSLANSPRTIAARQMSAGVVLVTAFLALRYGTDFRRYLVEEPENGVHPHAAAEIVRVLRELAIAHDRQVIATTHSPLVLNQVAPEEVLVVTRHAEVGVKVTSMVDSQKFQERIRDFDLGELWYNVGEDELVAGT